MTVRSRSFGFVLLAAQACSGTVARPDRGSNVPASPTSISAIPASPAVPPAERPAPESIDGGSRSEPDGALPMRDFPALPAQCVGNDFDLDQLISKKSTSLEMRKDHVVGDDCASRSTPDSIESEAGPDTVDIQATLLKNPLAPGAASSVRVTFRNRSNALVTMVFGGCDGAVPPFDVLGAFDAQGDRADEVPADGGCGVSLGCSPWRIVLRVEPRGSVTATTTYRAVMRKVNTGDCRERPHGLLRKGDYVLRIRTPLVHRDARGMSQPRIAEMPLRVGR